MERARKEHEFCLWFKDLSIADVPRVGGKNAALGEMIRELVPLGVSVPNGFAITAEAFSYFLKEAGIDAAIHTLLEGLDVKNMRALEKTGEKIRGMIRCASLPRDLEERIVENYRKLGLMYSANPDVAVRSSATAEDLPGASFAGQQETYLNVVGEGELLSAVKNCMASLFTGRAISYRADKGFSHAKIALSVGVQKMVRSDKAASGVMFTIDTETGFDKICVVTSIYGLGELIVGGEVTPDEFLVFKPALEAGRGAIISRKLGAKQERMVYGKTGTRRIKVSPIERATFSITDDEVRTLARWGVTIEKHFSKHRGTYQPMDIEWAKDGVTGELFIVQARPETIHAGASQHVFKEYRLEKSGTVLLTGIAIGTKIDAGEVCIVKNPKDIESFKAGSVLVTEITDPDWEPIMKRATAIITEKGGRTSHAAIVSRELGVPCIVNAERAMSILKNKQVVTVDCSSGTSGVIYAGRLPFVEREHHLTNIPKTHTKVMVNIGSPDEAFRYHYLPVEGVGLGRLEFIIAGYIKIHPNALINYADLKKGARHSRAMKQTVREIDELTAGWSDKKEYYVARLAEGMAKIAAAFYPHPVILRFSDFKTNEYRKLIGGSIYEPEEENPMIGWRGASRYYNPSFIEAFALECRALKRVREEYGLTNAMAMIPFCRTVQEGKQVVDQMRTHGLSRAHDKELKIYVMCEIPSNVLLAQEFLEIFDGMSIGSNDLTQLTVGLDRDAGVLAHIANENNPAVKELIKQAIQACHKAGKYIGICGQAPSDYPEFARFLVQQKISSISLNPDAVIPTLTIIHNEEQKLH